MTDQELAEKLLCIWFGVEQIVTGPDGIPQRALEMAQAARALITAELATKSVPGEDEISGAKDKAVSFVFSELATTFGLSGFQIRDGSETWEGDVSATLWGILRQANVVDDDDNLTIATLQAQADAARAEVERLREEMRGLYKGYVRTLETARDRIRDLGGDCDPVDVMEAGDPVLIKARAALAAKEGE